MTHGSPSPLALTDTQLVLLSQASQRADGKVVPPAHLKGSIFRRVMASLVGKGLVQTIAAPEVSAAGQQGDDPAVTFPVISSAGLAALGIADEVDGPTNPGSVQGDATDGTSAQDEVVKCPGVAPSKQARSCPKTRRQVAQAGPDVALSGAHASSQAQMEAARQPRAGSKQAMVLDLLAHRDGTTLDEVMTGTGWLPHTARAVLSGLRKRGYGIERITGGGGDGGSRYRLIASGLRQSPEPPPTPAGTVTLATSSATPAV